MIEKKIEQKYKQSLLKKVKCNIMQVKILKLCANYNKRQRKKLKEMQKRGKKA